MDERIIHDWLADSTSLSPGEVSSFASSLKHNNELIKALFLIFDEHMKFHNLIEPISKQLFNYYRSKEFELRLFTLQFLPNLIYIYLNSVARGDKKSYHSIETLLIGIYNLEVVDDAGQPAIISFRMPSLAQASIYHEPMSLAHVSLTETALRRLEECNTKLISWGPHPQVETLNAQNRLKTITKLLFIYNRHIGSFNKLSLKYLCKVSSSLASQGFGESVTKSVSPKSEGSKDEKLSRIPVSFQFLLELLCGLYYAMYNDYGCLALQAVDDIYNRSCYECFANVLVVVNAIKNSSEGVVNGRESEGPMGISVALSPATTTVTTVNKFMITNASFRTKKLPDDLELEIGLQSMGSHRSLEETTETSEMPTQKSGRKGKWKGWPWLHSSSIKTPATESEEVSSPKIKSNNPQASPLLRKKSNVRRYSADMLARHEDDDQQANSFPARNESPKRRTLSFASSSPNRRSAGARLCMVFEEENAIQSDPEELDEVADDIPIIQKEESGAGAPENPKPLTSITEEKEEVAFSLRGSSLRSKEAVAKNLQKLGIGKKFKEKDSKQSLKGNPSSNERKQTTTTTLLQLSGFKDKGSHKSGAHQQNGDFAAEVNGHSSPCSGRTKFGEMGGGGETSSDALPEEEPGKLSFENANDSRGDPLESSPANDVIGMFTSTVNSDEKSFTKVSSV